MTTQERLKAKVEEMERQEAAAAAEERKKEGNDLFAAGDNLGAVEKFSEGIKADPSNHILFSNRCAANLKLMRTRDAVSDGTKCTELKADWAKGWKRLGDAFFADRQSMAAIEAYQKGLELEPKDPGLLEGLALVEPVAKKEKEAKETEEEAEAAAKAKLAADEAARAAAEPKELEPVIGIDLGTTFSCVAVWGKDGPEILTDEDGSRTMPSYVSWAPSGERFIGQRAKTSAARYTRSTVYDVKRIIGQRTSDEAVKKEIQRFPFPVVEGPAGKPLIEVEIREGEKKRFAPEEISAMILGRMKQVAERALQRSVKKAVVTVPAYFNDAQRQATKNAGAIAGLEVLRIINEPTAAALAYGMDQLSHTKKGVNVLIFDLGGGTFDVTTLHIEGGVFDVLATGGDTQLGGEDFDNALVDWLRAEIKKTRKVDISDAKSLAKLKAAAEHAKRVISTSGSSTVEIEVEGSPYSVDVTRAQFEALNAKIFNRTLDTVKAVIKDSKLTPSEIDDIVLVGGSTRVPRVQELLSDFFSGRQLCRSINPDEAVAVGAAVQGAILSGQRSTFLNSIVLVDVTPLSLGVEVHGAHMSAIIPRNTKVPCRTNSMYTTDTNYQEELDVRIFEGERPNTEDNHLLGDFRISGIERAKRGEPKVEVTFELDTNGLLKVTAKDKKTEAVADCTISNACKGLAEDEITRMVEEAEKFAQQDEELRHKIELKNELQSVAYDMREKHTELADETLNWLDDLDLVTCKLESLELRRRTLERKASTS
jgi:L1 cell adhesion molecule like protein